MVAVRYRLLFSAKGEEISDYVLGKTEKKKKKAGTVHFRQKEKETCKDWEVWMYVL